MAPPEADYVIPGPIRMNSGNLNAGPLWRRTGFGSRSIEHLKSSTEQDMKYHLAIALLAVAPAAFAQQKPEEPSRTERLQAGATLAGTMNIHTGAFSSYDGVLECGTFEDSQTLGWQAGYSMLVPFSQSFALAPRLYYWKGDGDFTAPNPYPVRVAVDDNTVVPLETENTLETALDYMMLDVMARWRFAGPFYLAAGPSVGYAARAAYEQEEHILSPQGVRFQNGETSRNIIAGNFDEQGTLNTRREFRVAGTAALGADIFLSDRFVLNPEVSYSRAFTDVLSTFDWKADVVAAGVSLRYVFGGERVDTLRPDAAVPQPLAMMNAVNQEPDGSRLNYAEVLVTEDQSSEVIPLLPYVFFAANSAEIPARYRRIASDVTSGFSEHTLRDSTLEVYHHLLDIVGSRMRSYPEATIALTGNREPLDDVGGTDALSAARAAAVKEYLTSVWGIAPERISSRTRVLPEQVSNRTVADGREENRRAEISSNDPRILAPVTRRDAARRIDPAAVIFQPQMQFGESVTSWTLTLAAPGGAEVWRQDGTGTVPAEIPWQVAARAVDAMLPAGATEGSVTARLEARTADGGTVRTERAVPVRRSFRSRRLNGEIVSDSLLERYNLIFFDFDTPRISDFNRPVVDLIHGRMRTSSSVGITGLTDRIGEENYNRELSARRAEAMSAQVRSRIVPERMAAEGAGERLIYNNDLPEGRMYNRTVVVEITTPLEEAL